MTRNRVPVLFTKTPSARAPEYRSEGAAGADLRADLPFPLVLDTMERAAIPTGLCLELPEGFEAQVRPRSGLALERGITCLNSPGTIDSDFRGEIKVILINLGKEPATINPGDRIAQLVISAYTEADFEQAATLSATTRGSGGFGSTGKA